MIGIVLWSDVTAAKAVIWCEDQGDLAFYSHVGPFVDFDICVGDWVMFDVKMKGDLRLAHDIQVLLEPGCPTLADGLSASKQETGAVSLLQLVGQEDAPCDRGAKNAGAGPREPTITAASAALMAQAQTTCVQMPEDQVVKGRDRTVLPTRGRQNVIVFPAQGDGRLRRA